MIRLFIAFLAGLFVGAFIGILLIAIVSYKRG